MVYVDIDASCRVKFFDSDVVTKKPELSLCTRKFNHYYDVVLISLAEFIDKQRNDNDPLIFSINLFEKDGNDMKLYKQLTTIVHNDWNWNLFAIYLCERIMKEVNTLFIYLFNSREG